MLPSDATFSTDNVNARNLSMSVRYFLYLNLELTAFPATVQAFIYEKGVDATPYFVCHPARQSQMAQFTEAHSLFEVDSKSGEYVACCFIVSKSYVLIQAVAQECGKSEEQVRLWQNRKDMRGDFIQSMPAKKSLPVPT